MRAVTALAVAMLCAAPSTAQWSGTVVPSAPVIPAPYAWSPTADYVEAGQDEPGYRQWITQTSWRGNYVGEFHRYLEAAGVAWVAPTWQLLRTASDWRRCGAAPFEVPPMGEWANIVNTLRYVRDHVVPVIGPVEPVSVFRNSTLNRCAGGARESVHQNMSAIDFVPLRPIGRDEMIRRLCAVHQRQGPRFSAGLGFYTKMRFHVDTSRYRTWGRNDGGGIACPKVEWPTPVLASAPAPTTAPATTTAPGLIFRTLPPAAAQVGSAVPVPASPPAAVSSAPPKDPLAPL